MAQSDSQTMARPNAQQLKSQQPRKAKQSERKHDMQKLLPFGFSIVICVYLFHRGPSFVQMLAPHGRGHRHFWQGHVGD